MHVNVQSVGLFQAPSKFKTGQYPTGVREQKENTYRTRSNSNRLAAVFPNKEAALAGGTVPLNLGQPTPSRTSVSGDLHRFATMTRNSHSQWTSVRRRNLDSPEIKPTGLAWGDAAPGKLTCS